MGAQKLLPALVTETEKVLPQVFKVQFALEVKRSSQQTEPPMQESALALVNPHDERHDAVMVLTFPKISFCAVVSEILSEKISTIEKTNADAVGEIMNMVYCGVRKPLNESGFAFQPAVPTVMWGNGVLFSVTSFHSIERLFFEVLGCPFSVTIGTKAHGV